MTNDECERLWTLFAQPYPILNDLMLRFKTQGQQTAFKDKVVDEFRDFLNKNPNSGVELHDIDLGKIIKNVKGKQNDQPTGEKAWVNG